MPALAVAIALLLTAPPTAPAPAELAGLNSGENEVVVTFAGDEAFLERRSGTWGSPDGRSTILRAERIGPDAGWRVTGPAPFSVDQHDEGDPFWHAATRTLWFTSDRPHPDLPESGANLWRVRREDDGAWGEPEALPAPVNGPGAEYSPVVRGSRGERLYFASYRDGGGDVYAAEAEEGGGWRVETLGAAVNGPGGEWNVWVSEDEDVLIFESSGRATNVTVPGDLYASLRDGNGAWLPAVPLTGINGAGSDLHGRVVGTERGDQLVYASSSEHPEHTDLYAAAWAPILERVESAWEHALLSVGRSSHDLRAIDLRTGETGRRFSIGPGPHLVSMSPGTSEPWAAVSAYGVFPRPHDGPVEAMPGWVEEEGGELLILDPGTGSEGRLRLPCERPHGTAWDDDGGRLWATCEDREGVVEVDLDRSSPGDPEPAIRFLPTGHPGAHWLLWDTERDRLLVAHVEGGGLAIVDPNPQGAIDWVELAPGAEALWLDPHGGERGQVWVTLGPSGAVAVVDVASATEVTRIEDVCAFPIDFAPDPDRTRGGDLLLACFGSSEIAVLDTETRAVTGRFPLPAGPLNLEAHPELPVLYASFPRILHDGKLFLIPLIPLDRQLMSWPTHRYRTTKNSTSGESIDD